jgi:toxin-antitoxin system PIN domain toxin
LSGDQLLFDVNVLIALLDDEHVHHKQAIRWFNTIRGSWGTCAFTETGFLRLVTNGTTGRFKVVEAIETLHALSQLPGFRFWPCEEGWIALTSPFSSRIQGPRQITDAYLLGLAIKGNGILVTLDRGIRHLAGERYARHVLVLE